MKDNQEKNIEQTLKEFRRVSLSENERKDMFARIDAFVEKNPMKQTASVRSPYSSHFGWSFFATHTRGLAFAAVVFVVLGSTSAAAQYALPGDLLYPVKVKVNEEVLSVLSRSDASKAKFESKRAEERLKEATTLARSGELDEKTKTEIQANLKRHLGVVKDNIQKLRNEGSLNDALTIGTNLEVALRSSENELEKIYSTLATAERTQKSQTNNVGGHVTGLVNAVEEEIVETTNTRIETETSIVISNDNETLRKAAMTKRDVTARLLTRIEPEVRAENVEPTPDNDLEMATGLREEDTMTMKASFGIADSRQADLMMAKSPEETKEDIILEIKRLMEGGEQYLKDNKYKEAFESFNIAFDLGNTLDEIIKEESSRDNPEIILEPETILVPQVEGAEIERAVNVEERGLEEKSRVRVDPVNKIKSL